MLELVGAPNLAANLGALAPHGRIVVIGVGAGFKAEVNLLAMMGKRAADRRLDAARPPARGEGRRPRARWSATCCRCSSAGALRVPVAATYPLDEVAAAYERFAAGGKLGKIVLELVMRRAEAPA